jgi:ATP-dependent DNA helicase RecG
VATTVVEVDVPDATLIVIEHAERFGIAQLHQLRGRVGRGSDPSRCFLVTPEGIGKTAGERVRAVQATTDGFRLAETDQRLPGPGDVPGARQSGLPEDADILLEAREGSGDLVPRPEGAPRASRAPGAGPRGPRRGRLADANRLRPILDTRVPRPPALP